MTWDPNCTAEPCICPGTEVGQRACAHCGELISLTHHRRWPGAKVHATCASSPVVDGVCPHAGCCCKAHRVEPLATDERRRAMSSAWACGYAAAQRDALNKPYSDTPEAATWKPTSNPYTTGATAPCEFHKLVQHRDRKRPWCDTCGRATDGELIGRPRAFGPRRG